MALSPFASEKVYIWANDQREFVKRAAFSTIAQMAWKKNDIEDQFFIDYLDVLREHACDSRLYVKKAVNWALRDIGKRNEMLREHACKLAYELQKDSDKTRRWVGTHRFSEIG